ncbi:MAG: 50S ribosomal protein L13 [Enterobacteriaceae bacterium]
MKNFKIRKNYIKKNWYIIDVSNKILGRVSSFLAFCIMGKNNLNYSYNKDVGDFFIVINAKNIRVSGKKLNNKIYYKHTGYIGNLKKMTFKDLIKKNPSLIIKKSVKGMLPKNKLSRKMIKKLKIYPDENYKEISQKPKKIDF